LGYNHTFLPKASSPCRYFGFPDDGVGIFYKRERFALERSHTARFGLVQELRFLAALEEQGTAQYLVLAACHLKAKESAENEQRRHQQVTDILETIQRATANILSRTRAIQSNHQSNHQSNPIQSNPIQSNPMHIID